MHLIYHCPDIEYIVNIVKNAQTSNMILLGKYGLETTHILVHIRVLTGDYKHDLFIIIIALHHKHRDYLFIINHHIIYINFADK